jgi:hypothetical protein
MHHPTAVPHQYKYNYYNYQPKYAKFQDYLPQRTDQYNQVCFLVEENL